MTSFPYDPELLRMDFLSTAEWRQRKADEHPDDTRNHEAAEMLERLAATVDAVEPAVLNAYGELFEDAQDSEAHSEILRTIGFSYWPKSASAFVKDYVASKAGS
jgi:hypothetical protein